MKCSFTSAESPAACEPTPGTQWAPLTLTAELRRSGLTRAVLSAHTRREEQHYVGRFREQMLSSPYSCHLPHGSPSRARRSRTQGR